MIGKRAVYIDKNDSLVSSGYGSFRHEPIVPGTVVLSKLAVTNEAVLVALPLYGGKDFKPHQRRAIATCRRTRRGRNASRCSNRDQEQ